MNDEWRVMSDDRRVASLPSLVTRHSSLATRYSSLVIWAVTLALTGAAVLASRPAARPQAGRSPQVDVAGDPLPPGATSRLGTVRLRHGAAVHQIQFSPDSKSIFSVSPEERSLRIWDAATGAQRGQIANRAIVCLAISPDGNHLATGESDGRIRIWDLAAVKEIDAFAIGADGEPPLGALRGEVNPIHRIAFAGSDCIAGFHAAERAVFVWDIKRRRKVAHIALDADAALLTFAVSGDGSRVLTGSAKGELAVWNSTDGKHIRTLNGHAEQITAVALNHDGTVAVSSSIDQTIRGWDTATGKEMWQLVASGFAVALTTAPNGQSFAVAEVADSGTIQLHSLTTGKRLRSISLPFRSLIALAYSPDSSLLATGGAGNAVRIWSVATGEERPELNGHSGPISTVGISADGRRIVTCSTNDTVVRLWDAATGLPIRIFEDHPAGVDEVQLSQDGRLLATGSWDHPVLIWDTATGRCLHALADHPSIGPHFRFSSDGQSIATAGRTGAVGIWSTKTGKLISERSAPPNEVSSILTFAHGRLLAIEKPETDDETDITTIPLWDITGGRLIRRFSGHRGTVNGAVLSPDGRTLASCGDDQTIRVWEVATGHQRRTLHDSGQPSGWVGTQFLCFSPDGRTLATCGNHDPFPRLWDLSTGQELPRLEGHRGWIGAVEFSPDGRRLITGSQDTTTLIWDFTDRFSVPPLRAVSAAEIGKWWEDLLSPDSAAAYAAIWALIDAGDAATAFLRERLKPESRTDPAQIARWIEQLDHPQYTVRERATAALGRIVDQAEDALREAMRRPSLETRERIRRILDTLPDAVRGTDRLRICRALEVLEGQASPAARAVLAELSRGAANAWLTREAIESLRRLERRVN